MGSRTGLTAPRCASGTAAGAAVPDPDAAVVMAAEGLGLEPVACLWGVDAGAAEVGDDAGGEVWGLDPLWDRTAHPEAVVAAARERPGWEAMRALLELSQQRPGESTHDGSADAVRVGLVVAWEAQRAWVEAQSLRAVQAVAGSVGVAGEAEAEVGGALRMSTGSAGDRVAFARDVHEVPGVLEELEAGRLSWGRLEAWAAVDAVGLELHAAVTAGVRAAGLRPEGWDPRRRSRRCRVSRRAGPTPPCCSSPRPFVRMPTAVRGAVGTPRQHPCGGHLPLLPVARRSFGPR